jgi:integrase
MTGRKGRITRTKLKSGGVSWGYVFDAGRHQNGKRCQVVRKGFKLEREAVAALEEALGEHKKGSIITKDPATFGEFFRDWLEQHGAAHWGRMTAEQNHKRAAYAIRMFGDVPIQKLTSMRIEQALGTLLAKGGRKTATHPEGRPLSSKTVREVAALVSQALDKAVRWRKIERNPMAEVERPAAHRKEVQIMEPHEYEQFLNRVQGTRYYPLAVFAAASGCRRGEILALRWADIDPHSGVVTISKSVSETKAGREIKVTKSGKTRFVRVSQTTLHVLLEHRAQLDEEKRLFGSDYKNNDLVFPTPDGDYYKTDQVTGRISEFMQQACVDASLHSLRHFSASMMLSQHVPITVVSKRLGHANSQITLDVYAHAMKNDEATAATLWDDATADIIGRTRRKALPVNFRKVDVIFCDPKGPKLVVNE